MQESKLILLINALKAEEHKSFGIFLQSSFFTKSGDVVSLWVYLLKLKKQAKLKALKKEVLYKKLFPDTAFNDVKLRNLMRKLTRILEEFLILKEYQSRPTDREILLNKIYRRRNVFSLYEKSGHKITKALEANPERGSHYFLENYQWQKQHYFHPNTEKNDTSVLRLQDAFKNLHHFYSIEKLHMEVEVRNHERIYSKQYDEGFFDTQLENYPAPILLEKVAKLIQTQDLEVYSEVKKLFYKRLETLNKDDRNVVYAGMLNFSITKIPLDEEKFSTEVFGLYKTGLELNILVSDEKISGTTFFNIANAGSSLGQFEWVQNFIKEYSDKVSIINKEDYLLLTKAYWHFYQNQFDDTLTLLVNYKFNYPILNLNAKSLICRTFFEQSIRDHSFIEPTENAILSFEKQLNRLDTLTTFKKQSYLNFISTLSKILKLYNHTSLNKPFQNQLLTSTQKAKNIFNKNWLIKKIIRGAFTPPG